MPRLKNFSVLVLFGFLCPILLNAQNYSNTALDFDGVDDYVNLNSISATEDLALAGSDFTIEAWIYHIFTSEERNARIVDKSDGANAQNGYALIYNHKDATISFYCAGSVRYYSATTLAAHKWYHIAITGDGSKYRIYLDGEQIEGITENGYAAPPEASANMAVGNWNTDTTQSWMGRMDELRIWNMARTDEQIQYYKNIEIPGDEDGLVAYYRMNNDGTTFTDKTENSFNGTLANFELSGSQSNWATSTALRGDTPAGTGTSLDPYQMKTIGNLFWLSNNEERWEKHYLQTNDIDARITSSWRDGNGFYPIGESATKFEGSYDGQKYKISNLHIEWEGMNIGFFGIVKGAAIENITLENSSVKGSGLTGSLVGQLSGNSILSGCSSSGTLDGNGNYSGGLVGWNNNSTIEKCYSTSNVDGLESGFMVGGLVGLNAGSLDNSYSAGSVSGVRDVGGLVGVNSGTVSNCYSKSDVTRETGSYTGFGGFVGENSGAVEFCYSIGSVVYLDANDPSDKGFEGVPGGTNKDCFFDRDVSNQSSSILATAKTSAEMKTIATFINAGWDFELEADNGVDDHWVIDSRTLMNNGYPFLKWENRNDAAPSVELSSFFATSTNADAITLHWTTAREIDNLGFVLERKTSETEWTYVAGYETDTEMEGEINSTTSKEYGFEDTFLSAGIVYTYRLSDVDLQGHITYHPTIDASVLVSDLGSDPSTAIKNFALYSNYPNPFNPQTTIRFDVPTLQEGANVKLRIFNSMGQIVHTLVDGVVNGGQHALRWDASSFSSGVYYIIFESGQFVQTNKMVLLR